MPFQVKDLLIDIIPQAGHGQGVIDSVSIPSVACIALTCITQAGSGYCAALTCITGAIMAPDLLASLKDQLRRQLAFLAGYSASLSQRGGGSPE
jgi:hypothetical protein